MTDWLQASFEEDGNPFIVGDSASVNLYYPVGLITVSTLAHKPRVQIIFIAELDSKLLVAVPRSVWHKKQASRILPAGWVTKMTAVESLACGLLERDIPVEGLNMKLWVGFLKPEMRSAVEFTEQEIGVEYVFDAEVPGPSLPFGQALADAANEHFSFFSAAEVEPGDEEEEEEELANGAEGSGSASMSSRVQRLEGTIQELASNIQVLLWKAAQQSTIGDAFHRPSSLE